MIEFFTNTYKNVTYTQIFLEFVAFIFGITSVWFAKKENLLVYPTGLISTIITVYLLYQVKYFGDMTMNFYYSIMSIYGWFVWSKNKNQPDLQITSTSSREKKIGFGMFLITIIFTYFVYQFFNQKLEIPNYIDIFTSGIFFAAMWFMALKKIENWILWILGDCIAVPLFAHRDMWMLSIQYLIFTILAIYAYLEWKKILDNNKPI